MWNSGRLASMIATVSPRPTPRPARPPAMASTRSSTSDQVNDTLSSGVRTATSSGWLAAVRRSASTTVGASTARPPAALIVLLSMLASVSREPVRRPTLPDGSGSADAEALARQRADVVRQSDGEQHQDDHEADHPGTLHHLEGDPPPADLLGHRPE